MIPSLAEIARPSERNVALRVVRLGERALRRKHPWLFESAVREQSHAGRTGDLAVIFDRNRKFLAVGLYDPLSPIRVRLLHSGKPAPLDAEFYRTRFHELARRREHLLAQGTNGFRVVHGENDGLPGLIIDRYAAATKHEVMIANASCSARIPSEDFFQLVHHSARRFGRVFQEFHRSEHAVDHLIGFPQEAYLKCLFAIVR